MNTFLTVCGKFGIDDDGNGGVVCLSLDRDCLGE